MKKQAFASLALTLADGSPQVTPIWFGWDGTHIILNTARGRVKDRVMKRGGQVALLIVDPAHPESLRANSGSRGGGDGRGRV